MPGRGQGDELGVGEALRSPCRTLRVGIKDGKAVDPLRLVSLCRALSFWFHASKWRRDSGGAGAG